SGEPSAAQTKDIPKRKLANRQPGMAFAEARCVRSHLRTYKKDIRTRAARMAALEDDDNSMAVWCVDGMKCSYGRVPLSLSTKSRAASRAGAWPSGCKVSRKATS